MEKDKKKIIIFLILWKKKLINLDLVIWAEKASQTLLLINGGSSLSANYVYVLP